MSADDEDDDWEEDWDEEEDTEEFSDIPGAPSRDLLKRSLALGWLAMTPLFIAYELALIATAGEARNTSELVLFRIFANFGELADPARWVALTASTIAALVYCLRHHLDLGPRVMRIIGEGVVAAIVIGPALIGLLHLFSERLPPLSLAGGETPPPQLAQAAFVFGAGAYEELVFRVGAYSLLYLMVVRIALFFGAKRWAARIVAEAVGLLGSAALFSAFHLALLITWLGPGGEDFDISVFTYRALAGILLGILFRLRGPGAAAWAHGLFNLSLLLGAGPDVFL